MENRQAMRAILYVLRTRCRWQDLPRSLGAASTVHDRYQEWQEAGVFQRMKEAGLWETMLPSDPHYSASSRLNSSSDPTVTARR